MKSKFNLLMLIIILASQNVQAKGENSVFANDRGWIDGRVGYQIYIDSFRNANVDNDPIFNELGPEEFSKPKGELRTGTMKEELVKAFWGDSESPEFSVNEWMKNFEEKSSWERDEDFTSVSKYKRYYGGDFQGIEEKLDYLKRLGVDYILLSSPFYANSNHKYDAIYLHHVDPYFGNLEQTGVNKGFNVQNRVYNKFGAKELDLLKYDGMTNRMGEVLSDERTWVWTDSDLEFARLVKKIHEKRMKIIVEVSPHNFKDEDYIYNSIKKWLYGPDNLGGIDGVKFVYYRREDAHRLKNISQRLKRLKRDFIILHDNNEKDYNLVDNIVRYIVNTSNNYKIDSNKFANNLIENYDKNRGSNLNFVSSMDTDRIFSAVINPNRGFDRNNKNVDGYLDIRPDLHDENVVKKVKQIVGMQILMPGSPIIYYGDEKGMWGSDAPRNRKAMLWEDYEPYAMETDDVWKYSELVKDFHQEQGIIVNEALGKIFYPVEKNEEIEEFYKKVLKIRKDKENLFKNGKFRVLEAYNDRGTKERVDKYISDYLREKKRKAKLYKNEEINPKMPHIDFVTYEIYDKNETIMIIVNNSADSYPLNLKVSGLLGVYEDLLNRGQNYFVSDRMINVIVKPYEIKILHSKGKYF